MQQGINIGGGGGGTHEISLRLRPASDSKSFIPYHDLIHRILHELTHNHISPHNKEFFRLMEEMMKVSPGLSRPTKHDLKTGCVALTSWEC